MSDTPSTTAETNVGMGMDLPLIATAFTVGSIFVLVIILGTVAWFNHKMSVEMQTKSLAVTYQDLADLRTEQIKKITTYRWVDAQKGTVTVPIDRAMELIVAENKKAPIKGAVPAAVSDAVHTAVQNVSQNQGH